MFTIFSNIGNNWSIENWIQRHCIHPHRCLYKWVAAGSQWRQTNQYLWASNYTLKDIPHSTGMSTLLRYVNNWQSDTVSTTVSEFEQMNLCSSAGYLENLTLSDSVKAIMLIYSNIQSSSDSQHWEAQKVYLVNFTLNTVWKKNKQTNRNVGCFVCALLTGSTQTGLTQEKVTSLTSVHQSGFSNIWIRQMLFVYVTSAVNQIWSNHTHTQSRLQSVKRLINNNN